MFQLAGKWRLLAPHFIAGEVLQAGMIVGEGTPYPLIGMDKPSTNMEPESAPASAGPGVPKAPLLSASQGASQSTKLAAAGGEFKTVSAADIPVVQPQPQPTFNAQKAGPTPKPEQIPGGSVPPNRAAFANASNFVETPEEAAARARQAAADATGDQRLLNPDNPLEPPQPNKTSLPPVKDKDTGAGAIPDPKGAVPAPKK